MNEEEAIEENKRRKANRDAAKARHEGRTGETEEATKPGADCSHSEDASSYGEGTRSRRRRNAKRRARQGKEKGLRDQAIEKHLAEINRLRRLCEEV